MDEEEYASMSKLLQEFTSIPAIDKAWTFKSVTEDASTATMFLLSQPDLLSNKRRSSILSGSISRKSDTSVSFQWAPFPVEVAGVSTVVPSPSGSKLLVVRSSGGECSSAHLEIWGPSGLKKEFRVPRSVHGSVYTDGWLEGISWNSDETRIAYVAEEPDLPGPAFNNSGYKNEASADKDCSSWRGEGDWEEGWGETYSGRRQPALFVIDVKRFALFVTRYLVLERPSDSHSGSGEVRGVAGVGRELSVGQVVWAPLLVGQQQQQQLVFVGWQPSSDTRKFGVKYCYNRPCALYSVFLTSDADDADGSLIVKLTRGITSAYCPRFSPDGKSVVFLSSKACVDSGAHSATESLHKIEWPSNGAITDVVPVVVCPEEGGFPGLYCSRLLHQPWFSDGHTMVASSTWGSVQTILAVNVLSGEVSRISPSDSRSSWDVLAIDSDNIIAVCSSPVDIPEIKYGSLVGKWSWLDVSSPIPKCSNKVSSILASQQFEIVNIPVRDVNGNLTKGACKPFEAIYVSSKYRKTDPLVVFLHGGPHIVSLTSFSKSLAFLSSLGYSLLIVNYRGSLGFGEEALQSLLGNIGSQDVDDVLTALDYVVDKGLADPSKVFVLGGSHGGFLTTHLIGQAPEKFAAAATRNPLCNIPLMFGTSDIPDWCFVEACGSEEKSTFTESPSVEQLAMFYSKSPIAHVSKVKTPTLFLLGARDLRLPICNGIQYARALREKGVETKVIVFPDDEHSIDRPQSDYESYLTIGMWFHKHCKS